MRRGISRLLKKYGTSAVVVRGSTRAKVRIFFQPSLTKSWQSLDPIATPLGMIPCGKYLYIGPAEHPVAESDQVYVNGLWYVMRRAEACRDKDGPLYWWGLCVRKGGEDTWDSQA